MFLCKQPAYASQSLIILLTVALFSGSMTAFAQSAGPKTSWTDQSAGDSWREQASAACRRLRVQAARLDVGRLHRGRVQEGRVALKRTYGIEARDPNDLALITCDPFDFVGGAPRRIIVHATFRGDALPSRNEG
jgi:hypothetical protein